MEDRAPPTLEYRPPEARWTTRRWIWVWLPMSAALLAIALGAVMFMRYRVARQQLATARALQAAALANQQLAQQTARLSAQVTSLAATTQALAERAEPVAAIYTVGGRRPGMDNKLVIGILADGTVVWSSDKAYGGEPYYTAKLDPARIDQLLRDLDAAGFFESLPQVNFGPDAGHKVIAAKFGEKEQWVGSWHDPLRPNLVATELGLHVVQPGQAPPKPSAEYQRFIDAWDRAKRVIETAVPTEGEAIDSVDVAAFERALSPK